MVVVVVVVSTFGRDCADPGEYDDDYVLMLNALMLRMILTMMLSVRAYLLLVE